MKTFLLVSCCLVVSFLSAQDTIQVKNPSFELPNPLQDMSQCCKAPKDWNACGDIKSNQPDIQPGHFEVNTKPHDGKHYLSLVARDNETWEYITQELTHPIKAKETYQFSLALAISRTMKSMTVKNNKELQSFERGLVLRIWAGNQDCDRVQLLAKSKMILHDDWKTYHFVLKPEASYTHLTLEAFYKTPTVFAYNGNILLDNLSDIIAVEVK